MKKYFPFLLMFFPALAFADAWDDARSKNAGHYVETYPVSVSTSAATKLITSTSAIRSAYIEVFNNSAFTLWIGTSATTLQTTGYPVLSSTSYKVDGTYTGDLFGLANATAAGSTNARTIYHLKNDALR